MRYEHRDAPDVAAGVVSLGPVRDDASIDEEGTFEVDGDREDFEELHERLLEAGHEPLDGDDSGHGGDTEDDAEEGAAGLELTELTEQEIVEDLGYNEKQALGAEYDHIDGSASDDKLTEQLIEQLREEQEAK